VGVGLRAAEVRPQSAAAGNQALALAWKQPSRVARYC
jgi:hypothetical protein